MVSDALMEHSIIINLFALEAIVRLDPMFRQLPQGNNYKIVCTKSEMKDQLSSLLKIAHCIGIREFHDRMMAQV